jgi:hypothetical protein
MIDYIAEIFMRKRAAFTVNAEQARGIAGLGGVLCDLFLGQKIVEIRGTKACLGLVIYNNITHF